LLSLILLAALTWLLLSTLLSGLLAALTGLLAALTGLLARLLLTAAALLSALAATALILLARLFVRIHCQLLEWPPCTTTTIEGIVAFPRTLGQVPH
jgi:hypothetical protein